MAFKARKSDLSTEREFRQRGQSDSKSSERVDAVRRNSTHCIDHFRSSDPAQSIPRTSNIMDQTDKSAKTRAAFETRGKTNTIIPRLGGKRVDGRGPGWCRQRTAIGEEDLDTYA